MEHFKTDSMDDVFVELGIDFRYMDFEFIGRQLQNFDDGRFENYWGQIRKPIRNEVGYKRSERALILSILLV